MKSNFHLISNNRILSKFSNRTLLSPTGRTNHLPTTFKNTTKFITNDKSNITEKNKGIGNCNEKEVIYAAQFYKHKFLYIRHTEEKFSERFSKHATKLKTGHTKMINDNLNVTILSNNIKAAFARRYHEDKRICKLKTSALHGFNTQISDYTKEMYNFY